MRTKKQFITSGGWLAAGLLVTGLVVSPANAEDPAQHFEQLKEIEPPEGYVLQDIKESPEGARALALAVPDPRERDVDAAENRPVLLLLNEAGEVELEIGPETLDLETNSLGTASWLEDGESFVFVAFPPYEEPDPDLMAQIDEIEKEIERTDPEEETERFIELDMRRRELLEKRMEHTTDTRLTTALYRCDAATGEVERLWEINEDVWDVDVDRDGHIHVALADERHVQVLTPNGEPVTSHAIPFPETVEVSYGTPRLDASSHTIWATREVVDPARPGFRPLDSSIVRLRYGGEEPGEEQALEFEEEEGALRAMAPSGAALLYGTLASGSEGPVNFVYHIETEEHTWVPAARDVTGDGIVENISLAREGAAVRYMVVDLEREHRGDPVKRWEKTTLYGYTLPK
ncbi:MAG: hypothetical protein ACLFU6_11930 [Candidatus Hydrogenedentota bacterium]